jgi:hypothetical protein
MSIYALYGADEDTAENGKWFKLTKEISVKVRRFKSKKSRKVREVLESPYKRTNKFGALPEDVADEVGLRHVAEGILCDWKGITSKDGEPIPYSPDAAEKLFQDLPEFKDAVAELSLDLDNYRDEVKDGVSGN